MIRNLIKRIKCKHNNIQTITNLYGDAIIYYNCRSIKICKDCGKIIKSETLDKNCNVINFEPKEEI